MQRQQIGFFKIGIAQNDEPMSHSYMHLIAPSREHMDLAVLNYVQNYGIRTIETLTKEEYESNTQV